MSCLSNRSRSSVASEGRAKALRGLKACPTIALLTMTALAQQTAPLWSPTDPLWQKAAPDTYRVRVETTKGTFVLEAVRSLAPRGADRFYHLVESGFYDDSRFYRAVPGRFIQFGIAGNPTLAQVWRKAEFPDDKESASNARGWFGFAMTAPNTRVTQIYICTNDSMKRQDGDGFAISGMWWKAWTWWTRFTPGTERLRAAACAPDIRTSYSKKATPIWTASFLSWTGSFEPVS